MKAASRFSLNSTGGSTLPEFLRGLARFAGARLSSLPLLWFKTDVAVVRIRRADLAQTERGANGRALTNATCPLTTGHFRQRQVRRAATHLDRIIEECERGVKEVGISGRSLALCS